MPALRSIHLVGAIHESPLLGILRICRDRQRSSRILPPGRFLNRPYAKKTERLVCRKTLPFLNHSNPQSMQLPGWGMPQPYSYIVSEPVQASSFGYRLPSSWAMRQQWRASRSAIWRNTTPYSGSADRAMQSIMQRRVLW